MSVTQDVSGTLRAQEHGHQPVVCGINGDVAGTLDANYYKGCGERQGVEREVVCVENHPADSRCRIRDDGTVQTLSSRMGTGGNNVPLVIESPITASKASRFTQGIKGDIADTLYATDYKEPQLVAYGLDSYNQSVSEEVTEPLRSAEGGDTKPKVCAYGLDRASFNQGQNAKFDFCIDEEMVGPLTARGPSGVLPCKAVDCLNGRGNDVNGTLAANARKSLNSGNVVRCELVVRRLTPLECTRLQGFPDGWIDIGEWTDSKGKVHKDSDAPKYKALGNSIALPYWRWLAERIRTQYSDHAETITMASLFDGIGGFPLVFSQVGIAPVWASEIEEFPIAVTQLRFPE